MKSATKKQITPFAHFLKRAMGPGSWPRRFALRPHRARRRGATLVEFALVMPILVLLTLGMIQFGTIINARLSLSNTVRQVARFGAVNASKPGSDASIRDYAVATARGYGLTLKATDIAIGPPVENTLTEPNNRQRYVTQLPITVTYDLSPHIFMPVTFPGSSFLFKRQARYDVKVMVE